MLNRMEKDHIEHQPVRIGTLLVNEGFIRKADVAEAIDIQTKESQLAELALGRLLVKKGLIDKHQLQRLLEHPELRESVGDFAVERGLIDPRQLAECLRRKPKQQPLAEALVADGLLTDLDFRAFLEQQLDSMKLCELAVRLGMISENDLANMVRAKRHQRTIGEILCDLNLITPLDLNSVLTKYRKHLRLGEILLKNGWIDRQTLEMALLEHETRAEPLGNILTQKKILTEDQLFSAFAVQYNIPFRKLKNINFSDEERAALTKIIGRTFSRQFRIAPLSLENNTLTVAISDPDNLKVVQSLRSKRVDLRTQCVLVTDSAMKLLFDNLYPDGISSSPAPLESAPPPEPVHAEPPDKPTVQVPPPEPTKETQVPPETPSSFPDETGKEEATSAARLLPAILKQAVASGAEAVHIDRTPDRITLKFRVADTLHVPFETRMENRFQTLADPIIKTIKELSGLDVACPHRPQDGAFRGSRLDNAGPEIGALDFSVSTCPTLAGECMTIRPIQPCAPAPGLADLSHSERIVSSLKRAAKDLTGMILVAAPPGNGRAATLYGILRHIHQPDIKAAVVEDPISFSLPEAIQIQVNPAQDLTFPVLLRAALRIDPDILLTGDLPDRESVMLGFEAARKGVLFLGAFYAVDTAGVISGLRLLDLPPGYPINCLKAVLAQRYVRKVCPECTHTYRPDPAEWQPLFDRFPDHLTFHKGAGCPDCGFSGYKGRILLSELLTMTEPVLSAMKRGATEHDIRHLAIRSGMKTLIDDGLSKLDRTTLSEIIDAVPPEAAEVFKCTRADAETLPPSDKSEVSENVEFKMVLSAPEILKVDVQRLHGAYEVLIEQSGQRNHRSSLEAFETFIRSSHQSICRRYNCSRVTYCVQRRAGVVLLLASPEK